MESGHSPYLSTASFLCASRPGRGNPLVCDIELLARSCPEARFVGVTGTNGKSTATTLIAHILKTAGHKVVAGGNLGTPALDLPAFDADGIYVLELSSYQLELLGQARFDVGVLLNITPDHLARHGGMEGYVAAKASLFGRLRPGGTAVLGVDDDHCRAICASLRHRAHVRSVSVAGAADISAVDGLIKEGSAAVADLRAIATLPGRHNWQNAAVSYAAAHALAIPLDDIRRGLESYPGLAHRQEWIATIDGIRYVNDSKATNADAAEKAMVCYSDIYWIIGGQAKEGGITSLDALFPRVRRAFLIGEASDAFAATLEGKVAYERCGTLDVAVERARRAALAGHRPGAVVLLSPACASWDQFKSFEHRGDVFRSLVAALPGHRVGTGEPA